MNLFKALFGSKGNKNTAEDTINDNKVKEVYYDIHPENNNKIFIINDGIRSELKTKIAGLQVQINGCNNQIVIVLPSHFENSQIILRILNLKF